MSKSAALAIHEALLAEHGGTPGVRDEGLLDSALASPQNLFAYENADIFRLAAAYAYAYALTRNRPFHDGNKRVALTVAGVFLEQNGFRLEAPEPDAVSAMLALPTRELDDVALAAWLRDSSKKIPRRGKPRARRREKPGRRSRTRR